MKVAVTGGTGFIGGHLAQRLLSDGHDVVLLAQGKDHRAEVTRTDSVTLLDHLSHALHTFPLFAMVGLKEKGIRPLAVEDLVEILQAALVKGRLTRQTVAVTGAEELYLSEAVRRVAQVTGNKIRMVRAPVWFHYVMARLREGTMKVPLVARAQVRILSEGVVEPALPCDSLPRDLMPTRWFTGDQIRKGLPEPRGFGLRDLRCCA